MQGLNIDLHSFPAGPWNVGGSTYLWHENSGENSNNFLATYPDVLGAGEAIQNLGCIVSLVLSGVSRYGGRPALWKAEGPRFDSFSALRSLQNFWLMDTVLWLCLSINEKLKRLSSLPILMQASFWWWRCSVGYHIPHPQPPGILVPDGTPSETTQWKTSLSLTKLLSRTSVKSVVQFTHLCTLASGVTVCADCFLGWGRGGRKLSSTIGFEVSNSACEPADGCRRSWWVQLWCAKSADCTCPGLLCRITLFMGVLLLLSVGMKWQVLVPRCSCLLRGLGRHLLCWMRSTL